MKKSFFLFFAFVMVLPIWAQNNVITYTASEKLEETTNFGSNGLHVNAFDVAITSHDFSGSTGTITFSGDVTSIGEWAFYGCSGLTSITIPNSVTSIGSFAFEGCSGLTSIVVESGNLKYDSRNNCNAIIETTTNTLIVGCMNTSIPNSVTSIGNYAFYGCSGLTSVSIPNSVTSIGSSAFSGCSSLESIAIPEGVTSIGSSAFENCSRLTSITLPESLLGISDSVFVDCTSLISITIPKNVDGIGWGAFRNCSNLTSITLPKSVASIGWYAFEGCSKLASITIPEGVKYIAHSAFYHCTSLTSVTIPKSVEEIDWWAFLGCSSLTSITIPENVTHIGDFAFDGCYSLSSVYSLATTPPWLDEDVFPCPLGTPAYVPASAVPAYQTAFQWNAFDIQPLIIKVDSIAPDTTNLTWLPVDSAAMYRLRIYSNQFALDTTLTVLADPNAGGTQLLPAPSPYRQHRIVLDDGVGTLVVVVFDDNSGATASQPFVVTVSTSSSSRIDILYDMKVLGVTGDTIRQENGLFTLNEDAPIFAALGDVHSSPMTSDSFCYDLYGHRYPISVWPSLPAGIYILHEGGVTTKIMKH